MTRQTDECAIENWLAGIRAENTRRNYKRHATCFLAFVRKALADVTRQDVKGYLDHLRTSGTSFRSTAGAIKVFLHHVHANGVTPTDLGKEISTVQASTSVANRTLTERDITKMLLLERNDRNYAILMLAYSSGLQMSELVALKWHDVVIGNDGRMFLVLPEKRGKARKTVLSDASWRALAPLRGSTRSNDPIFFSKKGGHLDASAVHRVVKAAAARAGLPDDTSSYWLRHSHATHKLAEGTPIHLVQAALGHADRRTTQRYANSPVT